MSPFPAQPPTLQTHVPLTCPTTPVHSLGQSTPPGHIPTQGPCHHVRRNPRGHCQPYPPPGCPRQPPYPARLASPLGVTVSFGLLCSPSAPVTGRCRCCPLQSFSAQWKEILPEGGSDGDPRGPSLSGTPLWLLVFSERARILRSTASLVWPLPAPELLLLLSLFPSLRLMGFFHQRAPCL